MRKYWCPVCEKPVPADQLAVNVGDKVNITIEHTKITPSRTTVRVVSRVGKVTDIKDDIAAVTYRGKVYRIHTGELVPAGAPGGIVRAMCGECECGLLPEDTADD
ncbi:hypothetical protein JC794_03925 [Morganella morganii]|uniref:hypothetical protein n=1 Tax=Morganella morganii TaxID=582 RepID=UPI001C497582|nr:hypothetical protein [Morganella morganii]QXO58498.1 hypothetical protein JC827_03925 [Morganella morganii]QXO60743.1 hypothetical protein JC826_14845 [Morganella morganii]QXO77462.1 hypothetical protein JC794_03925 [Morganella morganii]